MSKFSSKFSKMKKIVLAYPKLVARLENSSSKKEDKAKILKNLEDIRADFSYSTIKTFSKFLDATTSQFYDGICLNENGVDFKSIMETSNVVLVPNHQSHADYVVINHMFFKNYGVPLYVAGGENLNIFPIGKLFRKSGCFFIRRSFANDIWYKLTLEAYLYYLLKEGKPIEFFFEGGRSRTGKLLPPKFGLYQMILEAHNEIDEAEKKPLNFVPVSIVHEYVPEQKTLAKELAGASKTKESPKQLLGIFKLFTKQFGTVHINLGRPVQAKFGDTVNHKKVTQDLAFDCFRTVGSNMVVTPMSLISIILLDSPSSSINWDTIFSKCTLIRDYCSRFNVPLTSSLNIDNYEKSLGRALDILIANKKVEVIGKRGHEQIFYLIKEDARPEMLYFKNTILHHFLVPWTINSAWINLFNGSIKTVDDLKRLFIVQRGQLKHEFYLPTVKEFIIQTLDIIGHSIGRKIETLDDCLHLDPKDLYAVASRVGVFSKVLGYINASYFISILSLKKLHDEMKNGFHFSDYNKTFVAVYNLEKQLGKIVEYPESCTVPLMRSTLKYFTHQKVLELDNGRYTVVYKDKIKDLIDDYEKVLTEQLLFKMSV